MSMQTAIDTSHRSDFQLPPRDTNSVTRLAFQPQFKLFLCDMSDTNYELQVSAKPCTLFANPESAVSVNEGVTLIPWMGDNSNMIDRYDVRGHLYSESEFGLRKNETDVDPIEDKLELELDKERFMFLTVDELEFEAYLEEEEKRFNSKKNKGGAYLQLGFSYGSGAPPPGTTQPSSIEEDIYIPHKDLLLPDGMVVPKTEKHYKIIEKTAGFLSTQSLQTEILIRTKQKDNAQFQFLEYDNELNPFYKHIVMSVKKGIIKIKKEPKPVPKPPQPLPMPVRIPNVPTVLPQQHYEQMQQQQPRSQWGKIYGETQHIVHPRKNAGSSLAALSAYGAASDDSSDEEVVEERRNMYNNNTPLGSMINRMSKPIPVPPGTSPEVIQYLIMSGFVALPPPAPGLPQLLVPPTGQEGFSLPPIPPPPPPEEEVHITQQEYYDSAEEERPLSPNPEQKGIITKLAEYVVKNGDSFEKKVLQKQDQRFKFVNPGDEHHNYYQYLIQKFRNKRVKLNVAPIRMRSAKTAVQRPPVDNTVFNQSSSEEEPEEEEEETSPDYHNDVSSTNHEPSPSPEPTETPSTQETLDHSGLESEVTEREDDLYHHRTATSPHPLDSDIESDGADNGIDELQEMVTSPKEESQLQSPFNGQLDRALTPPVSPAKTPVYTEQRGSTPSPSRTPAHDHTKTPEIRSPDDSPSPHADDGGSDVESVDSEMKGRPLVQHFSDNSPQDTGRYDLDDGHVSSQGSKSPAKSVHSDKGPERYSAEKELKKKAKDEKERKEENEKREKEKLRKDEKRKEEREKIRKEENEKLRIENEKLKAKIEEVPEEGELTDHSSHRKSKHKRHKVDRHSRKDTPSPNHRKPTSRHKKKKSKSKKREKPLDSDYGSTSSKKPKVDTRKRKRDSPPAFKKYEDEEWMSDKMKKLSKIELLKEIEIKIEEKKRQRENLTTESTSLDVSGRSKVEPVKESKAEKGKHLAMQKELEDIEAKLRNKKLKKIAATEQNDDEQKQKELEEIEAKLREKKLKKLSESEQHELDMQKELEDIEAKLRDKKLKKIAALEQKVEEPKKKSKTSEKVNGHAESKVKKKKAKDSKDSSKSKKS